MKSLISILLIPILFAGFCDFEDYWTVSVNESIVYDSRNDKNSGNRIYTLKLSELELTESDTLKILYKTDTPCPNCKYNLLLVGEAMEKKKLYEKRKEALFELTRKDFELFKTGPTEIIYFQSEQEYLRKILRIE